MEKHVIGVWVISNVASLNVWDINSDAALIGINDDAPEWCEIVYQDDEEDAEHILAGIMFHGAFWRLDECMSIR